MTDRQMLAEFGENLEYMLDERQITQKELAEKIGVGESTVNHYIKGRRMPTLATTLNIMLALDCELDDLIFTSTYIV